MLVWQNKILATTCWSSPQFFVLNLPIDKIPKFRTCALKSLSAYEAKFGTNPPLYLTLWICFYSLKEDIRENLIINSFIFLWKEEWFNDSLFYRNSINLLWKSRRRKAMIYVWMPFQSKQPRLQEILLVM